MSHASRIEECSSCFSVERCCDEQMSYAPRIEASSFCFSVERCRDGDEAVDDSDAASDSLIAGKFHSSGDYELAMKTASVICPTQPRPLAIFLRSLSLQFLMHPVWPMQRNNWRRAVMMSNGFREFALALGILESVMKPVLFNEVWHTSLGKPCAGRDPFDRHFLRSIDIFSVR